MEPPPELSTAFDPDAELPSYVGNVTSPWDVPPAQTEHSFGLKRKSGETWLSLTVCSRAVTDEDPPTFFQCGLITGSVKLNLEKEEIIGSVHISLVGRLSVYAHSASNFLNVSQQLWSSHEDTVKDPGRQPGKLQGQQEWPFSFRLPRGVSILSHLDPDSMRKNFRLPPSLSDSASGVTVQYELTVRVRRGRLRGGNKLFVPIMYIPQLRPCAPSILRQLAYQEQSPILGPERDSEGWRALHPVVIRGTLFKTRPVEVICTLSLARPLSYTRGTPLHLALALECNDIQALDLFSTNGSITVSLIQRTSFGADRPTQKSSAPRTSETSTDSVEMRSQELETAVWWRSAEDTLVQDRNKRSFSGEIQIPTHLAPRCSILSFTLDYAVVLYPFQVVGFSSATSPKEPLISQKVEIVTAHAAGPRPRAYAPPGYEKSEQPRRTGISWGGILVW
ncbi:hypothetical protein OBBRIDRAFT_788829 [Obba rivulosa]|uniref:Arrestin-like N-terminal domain-containing protein n=1 Tax=Obba rivulosa TaxID=1052685 RepID=A0A8E2DSE6_9APHY|nr:hypothetical protein OBBRIDRAFT_788829 [Obba rivulosa]